MVDFAAEHAGSVRHAQELPRPSAFHRHHLQIDHVCPRCGNRHDLRRVEGVLRQQVDAVQEAFL
eukprot:12886267-Prorocentrum_lima.AAC.1